MQMPTTKSPYKVHYSTSAGWSFTLKVDGKRKNFVGFKTDLQAAGARAIVVELIARGESVPLASQLKKMVPEAVDEAVERGRLVPIQAKDGREADALALYMRAQNF